MKYSKFNRLYIKAKLSANQLLLLDANEAHYLKNVLKIKFHQNIRIFNEVDGEYLASINDIDKKSVTINLLENIRQPVVSPGRHALTLCLAMIRPDKMFKAIDMAVQLDVAHIMPVITERSQFKELNIEKAKNCIIEAVEQSERLTVPEIKSPEYLSKIDFKEFDLILIANENEDEKNTILKIPSISRNICMIIGPEGGFTESEISIIASIPNAYSISLGNNVLRTETAVCASLAQINLKLS